MAVYKVTQLQYIGRLKWNRRPRKESFKTEEKFPIELLFWQNFFSRIVAHWDYPALTDKLDLRVGATAPV